MSLTIVAVVGILLGFVVILAGFMMDERPVKNRRPKKTLRRRAA